MRKFLHISLANEVEYLKTIENSLINSGIGVLNFHSKDELGLNNAIEQINFLPYENTISIDETDLDFIPHGSDVIGLWERDSGFYKRANFYKYLLDATVLLEKIKSFVIEHNIKEVWYNMVPHSFEDYLFAATVERLGGDVYYLGPGFFPWAQTLWKGLKHKKRITAIHPELTSGHNRKLQLLENSLQTPGAVLQQSQNQAFNVWHLLFTRPLDLLRRIPLFLWKKEYSKYSMSKIDNQAVIVYLHYQPEATNLPLFGSLVAQFSVSKRLTDLGRYSVFIKEHPNQLTETPPLKSGARWRSIYKTLRKNYSIEFLDITFSLDQAIEQKAVIFSIGGSVIFEYLKKGGEVIVPQETPLFDSNIFSDLNLESLGNGLYKISSNKLKSIKEIEIKTSITRNDDQLVYGPLDRFRNIVDYVKITND